MASLDIRSSKRIGVITAVYYMLTMIFASILGIILVILIHPGSHFKRDEETIRIQAKTAKNVSTMDSLLDLVRWVIFGKFLKLKKKFD